MTCSTRTPSRPLGRLQVEAARAFERSWHGLLENIDSKSAMLTSVG
jgi:hypothetical protein